MPFTIYLIHHSHTDIGYTDYQEQIEENHVYYIRHAIWILNKAHSDRPQWLGFVWQCECWWAVEKFLKIASEQEKKAFWKYVKSGEIGLSANYVNMTELIDQEVLETYLKKPQKESGREDVLVESAMTADINGYSWGYSDALEKAGVRNLLSFVHTHHGRYPLFKKQTPFWWITPSGKEVLVWLGDHYQVANELGISKLVAKEYTCLDGLGEMEAENVEKAELRIHNYVKTLKEQGYAYDFTVLGLSGYFTDNACPSPFTIEFVKEHNELYGAHITLKMVTLDEFFERLRAENEKKEFPKYRGDWADWWADGVGSTPVHVQHFREAQRRLSLAKQLDCDGLENARVIEESEQNMMIYAEHTWGHSASVVEPFDPGVNRLELRKGLYAQRAHEAASKALLQIAKKNGATPALYGQGSSEFVVMNPDEEEVEDIVSFEMEETLGKADVIRDMATGKVVRYQSEKFSRGDRIYLQVKLSPKEKRCYRLERREEELDPTGGMRTPYGAEGICDMPSEYEKEGIVVSPWCLENQWVRICIDEEYGIQEMFDKNRGISLLREHASYAPLTPIYEHTPVADADQYRVRKEMGRNRKSISTKRYVGNVMNVRILESGEVFDRICIEYDLEGTEICQVTLTVYRNFPKIDVDLKVHKKSNWDPENLYLSLPFSAGEKDVCWLEKTGAVIRPRIDQLPGSCIDFYLIQNGVWYTGDYGTVLVATPDTPLIALGNIKAHPIQFAGENEKNSDMLYSWVMNNFWETNFKVDLGGFHQYRYSIFSVEEKNPKIVQELARRMNRGLFSFQRTNCEFL